MATSADEVIDPDVDPTPSPEAAVPDDGAAAKIL